MSATEAFHFVHISEALLFKNCCGLCLVASPKPHVAFSEVAESKCVMLNVGLRMCPEAGFLASKFSKSLLLGLNYKLSSCLFFNKYRNPTWLF